MTLTVTHVLKSEDKDSGRGALCLLSNTHTEAYTQFLQRHTTFYIYYVYIDQKNGGLLLIFICLFCVPLFKIIRNDHILVRFSEEKGHYVIMVYIQKFSSYSLPPEVYQTVFILFIYLGPCYAFLSSLVMIGRT